MQIISTEALIAEGIKAPVITAVYDPLSRSLDGTITSQAPVVISGKNLNTLALHTIRLCLTSAQDDTQVIEVHSVYKYSSNTIIVTLPVLAPGTYFPTLKILKEGEKDTAYILPTSWVVPPEGRCRG